ncbi:hypothetical protein Taro_044691 [Colocasia esculenta]|uniref:PUM-HD domain-containing protein n=1 Tax=Colocasia esculenta TaxID=4460 RepID=A0A843WYS6_COLES|nr:hypothetical protein [Colocasia esculenta]
MPSFHRKGCLMNRGGVQFLLDAAIPHSVELAKDRQGCVVLQKCLNYVVQYLLELSVPSAMEVVLDKLEGNFAYLSVQKYSSNVVEKCLKYSGEDHHCRIISELINNPRLVQILQDPYGNYVIQSAIKSCKGALYDALVDAIRPHIPAIQSNPYGKKVLSTLSRKK